MITHDEAAELLGAYALDAVEPDEAEAIEAHLETCPRCRDELRGHREVVGLLAYAGQDAPEGLWDRVAARMHDPSEVSDVSVGRGAQASGLRLLSTPPDRAAGSAPRGHLLRWMTVAAAAALVVVALLGVEVHRLQDRTNHLSGQVAAMSDQPTMADVRAALATPGAQKVQLESLAGAPQLDAVILPSGAGYLYDSDLSPLASSRTYQLWGVVDNQVISYGVLGSALPAVESFRASSGVSALAVTNEGAGGVVASTQRPVAAGSVD
jgi:anti-sigma factor RsiW